MTPSAGIRARRWLPHVVATATFLLLLFAFQSVLHRIVRDGEARRAAVAEHSNGVWRCHGLRGRGAREACLQALETPAVTVVLIAP